MNNKKSLIIITIIGIVCILVGSLAYYRITVDGSIKGATGNAVFNVTGFTNESTKEITLKEGKLVPGDKGEFTLHLDATSSDVDMYVTLSIDKGTLPTNLKFYTTSDRKSELHKYYEFMDTSNQSKDITIYWYWNPNIDDEEDSNFINNTDVTATIKLDAVQISEYAMMKNGNDVTSSNRSEFWKDEYRPYIRMINFINDLSNLPETCNEENLCFDVSYSSTQNKKVYAYLIDSGLDYTDSESVSHDLYNLYIVSEAPIFAPSDCTGMFYNFINLTSINFNNNFNTSNVTNMDSMFWGCGSLTSLDVSSFNTSNVTDMSRVFTFCSFLTRLDLSSFNTSNVTNMRAMFGNCSSLTSLDVSSFNTSNVTAMGSMFDNCSSLTSLDLSSFNTSNVTDMYNMFYWCKSLTSLDISGFNTSNVINMPGMFYNCSSLTSLDISSFNTSNVTNMGQMFIDCKSLTSLDLSNFNTSNVTDMRNMFHGCSSLTSLDLSNFNTSSVTNMDSIFASCVSLTNLDLSSFNTANVTRLIFMFYNCSKLTTTINIMSSNVSSYGNMFTGAATSSGAKITVNYIADASALVDNMIATKWVNSNVVKGSQL